MNTYKDIGVASLSRFHCPACGSHLTVADMAGGMCMSGEFCCGQTLPLVLVACYCAEHEVRQTVAS